MTNRLRSLQYLFNCGLATSFTFKPPKMKFVSPIFPLTGGLHVDIDARVSVADKFLEGSDVIVH